MTRKRRRDPEPYAEDDLRVRRGRHEPVPVFATPPEPLRRCPRTIRYGDGGRRQCPYTIIQEDKDACARCSGGLG